MTGFAGGVPGVAMAGVMGGRSEMGFTVGTGVAAAGGGVAVIGAGVYAATQTGLLGGGSSGDFIGGGEAEAEVVEENREQLQTVDVGMFA